MLHYLAILESTSEDTSLLALLTAAVGLLATIAKYAMRAWKALWLVLVRLEDNANRLAALEMQVTSLSRQGSDATQDIQKKLNGGDAK